MNESVCVGLVEMGRRWKIYYAVYDGFLILPLLITEFMLNRPTIYLLEMMNELQNIHPHIYKNFQNGLHCAQRSDRFWAGLSTFWMIEQVLMRSVKTIDELTPGKGLSEMQRLVWLMSTTQCRP